MRKRIFAIFAAFLVLSSGVAAPATAATEEDAGEAACGGLDYLLGVTFANTITGSDYSVCEPSNDKLEELKESDSNQTHVDLYEVATAQKANSEVYLASNGNYVNDSESVAWMKMQVAVAEAYQNGSSEASAKVAAQEAINEYYATKQKNLIEQWNTSVSQYQYVRSAAQDESIGGVTGFLESESGDYDTEISFETTQMTLATGNTSDAEAVRLQKPNTVDSNWLMDPSANDIDWTSETGNQHVNSDGLFVTPPDSLSSSSDVYMVRWSEYADRWSQINSMNSNLKTESQAFVEATYADFETGQINASDVISSNTAMFEYGTEYDSNDSLYNTVGALSMMGFDTPNMTSSGTMDVVYNGDTYTGILMANNAPNGTWNTGTTYNTSNIEGPVFIATVDGTKVDFPEGAEFTVEQMRNRDGQNTTSVETTEYVYKTSNTSELLEMQQQLSDLRTEIEEREPDSGGGSGGGFPQSTIIAGAALAGAALLLGRGNQ
ncbi:hypothetical protein [Halobellus rufus]|uniref:hypothetical protein n=1 Tax=Halobellus rufus TaxID=1448860 RepID=UPI0006794212|nr:hypothetical protein [Halobellus rufus]